MKTQKSAASAARKVRPIIIRHVGKRLELASIAFEIKKPGGYLPPGLYFKATRAKPTLARGAKR